MEEVYGKWQTWIKPSDWEPDYGQCLKAEIERWERDCEREKAGKSDYEGNWGIGIYK
jgi:hypothetical protein